MRKLAAIVSGLLLGLALWSVGWFVVSRQAATQVDAWIATEAREGRIWTCPDRRIGGYPAALTVACSDPTYSGAALGQAVQASLAHLDVELSILHPRTVTVSLGAPFTYQTSDHQVDARGRWATLAIDLHGLPSMDAITLDGTDVAVDGLFGQAGRQAGTAHTLDARFDLALGQADPTIGFDIAVAGAPAPALDQLAGGTLPVDLHLVGTLDRAVGIDARTPEEAMERWRQAGGRIALQPSRLTRGSAFVAASGALGLDLLHRPQGRLAAQFVGVEPILQRYGISGNLAAAGSLLTSLFGGGLPRDQPAVPGGLSLPISLQNGRVGIGPIRTPIVLSPLY